MIKSITDELGTKNSEFSDMALKHIEEMTEKRESYTPNSREAGINRFDIPQNAMNLKYFGLVAGHAAETLCEDSLRATQQAWDKGGSISVAAAVAASQESLRNAIHQLLVEAITPIVITQISEDLQKHMTDWDCLSLSKYFSRIQFYTIAEVARDLPLEIVDDAVSYAIGFENQGAKVVSEHAATHVSEQGIAKIKDKAEAYKTKAVDRLHGVFNDRLEKKREWAEAGITLLNRTQEEEMLPDDDQKTLIQSFADFYADFVSPKDLATFAAWKAAIVRYTHTPSHPTSKRNGQAA